MDKADAREAAIDRAVIGLAEIALLHGHEGEIFSAVVTDLDERGARIQLCDRPVVARVDAHRVAGGDDLRVRLVEADPVKRVLRFERVG
jgi:exoribonuclease R